MVLRVATNTIFIQYVIIQLLLKFAGDGVTINLGRQVGAFEAFGEDGGALMGRALPFCVGLSLLFGGPGIQLAFVIRWGSGFGDLLGEGLGGILIEKFDDGRFYASEGRRVRALVRHA
jgi:hypothetical protein